MAVLIGLAFAILALGMAAGSLRREGKRQHSQRMVARRLDEIVDELRGIGEDLGQIRERTGPEAPAPVDLYRDD